MCQVNPVTRSVVDPKLAYSFADRFDIAQIAERESANARQYSKLCLIVPQFSEPVGVSIGLTNFEHLLTIIHSGSLIKKKTYYDGGGISLLVPPAAGI